MIQSKKSPRGSKKKLGFKYRIRFWNAENSWAVFYLPYASRQHDNVFHLRRSDLTELSRFISIPCRHSEADSSEEKYVY